MSTRGSAHKSGGKGLSLVTYEMVERLTRVVRSQSRTRLECEVPRLVAVDVRFVRGEREGENFGRIVEAECFAQSRRAQVRELSRAPFGFVLKFVVELIRF